MNKPQYLAELGQLLIFMTNADREQTLARYGALFDAAGPEGQDALLEKLGSTTRQAIRLSRIYDAAGYEDNLLDELEAQPPAEPAPAQPAPKPDPASRIAQDLPEFGLDDLPDLAGLPAEPEPKPEPARPAPAPEPEPAKPAPAADTAPAGEEKAAPAPPAPAGKQEDEADYEELWGKRSAPAEEKKAAKPVDGGGQPAQPEVKQAPPAPVVHETYQTIERVIPLWAGAPLFVLTVIFLVIPLAAICLLLIPALLLPGAAVLVGAFLAVVGGLWCISIIADAAVLFGTALILLALGLIILWIGLWTDVAMVTGFSKALLGLADLTLGKKVTVRA